MSSWGSIDRSRSSIVVKRPGTGWDTSARSGLRFAVVMLLFVSIYLLVFIQNKTVTILGIMAVIGAAIPIFNKAFLIEKDFRYVPVSPELGDVIESLDFNLDILTYHQQDEMHRSLWLLARSPQSANKVLSDLTELHRRALVAPSSPSQTIPDPTTPQGPVAP